MEKCRCRFGDNSKRLKFLDSYLANSEMSVNYKFFLQLTSLNFKIRRSFIIGNIVT